LFKKIISLQLQIFSMMAVDWCISCETVVDLGETHICKPDEPCSGSNPVEGIAHIIDGFSGLMANCPVCSLLIPLDLLKAHIYDSHFLIRCICCRSSLLGFDSFDSYCRHIADSNCDEVVSSYVPNSHLNIDIIAKRNKQMKLLKYVKKVAQTWKSKLKKLKQLEDSKLPITSPDLVKVPRPLLNVNIGLNQTDNEIFLGKSNVFSYLQIWYLRSKYLNVWKRKTLLTKCSHCNEKVFRGHLIQHTDDHDRRTYELHQEFNEVVLYESEQINVRSCKLSGHAICPQDPPGSCALDALKSLLFIENCDALTALGPRYWSGWYNSLDLSILLNYLGYGLIVEQEGRLIEISSPEIKGQIILKLVGRNHWLSARFKCKSIRISVYCMLAIVKLRRLMLSRCLGRFQSAARVFLSKLKTPPVASFSTSTNENLSGIACPTCEQRFDWAAIDEHVDNCKKVTIDSPVPEEDSADEDSTSEGSECPEIEYSDNIANDTCCQVPVSLDGNFMQFVDYLDSFRGKAPDYDCLFHAMSYSLYVLRCLDIANHFPTTAVKFLEKYLHFRHDVFGYIFANEIIGVNYLFDNEIPINSIDSNRTPDLHIFKDMCCNIYEFTVVGNRLRANFMKGLDNQSSKYKREIDMLQEQNYTVNYYPIVYSTSEDIDAHLTFWKGQGFETSDKARDLINNYSQLIDDSFNYLFSLSFDRNLERNFAQAEEEISQLTYLEDNWRFIYVSSKRLSLYKFIKDCKSIVDSTGYFKVHSTKNGWIKISNSNETDPKAVTGQFILDLSKDEGRLFNHFRDLLHGREECLIRTRSLLQEVSFKVNHGLAISIVSDDCTMRLANKRNRNLISMNQSKLVDDKIMSTSLQGLNQPVDETVVLQAIDKYKINLNMFYKPKNSTVIISPRRSFITLIDTSVVNEISYESGVLLSAINIHDVDSNLVKSVYSKIARYKFIKQEIDVPEAEGLKNAYKASMSEFYSALISQGYKKQKISLFIRSSAQRAKLEALRSSMITAQRKYQSAAVGSYKGLKLDYREIQMFKDETNWGPFRGYKLYKGKINNLCELIDFAKMITKGIKLRFELPSNDYDSDFMKALKQDCLNELHDNFNEVCNTNLFSMLCFISRLAYTLLGLSNQNYNSKFIKLDNLGLTDVMLLVKGGKKITSTRKTKIFKLITPSSSWSSSWNPSIKPSGRICIDETPWMQLNQSVLADMLSAPYKFVSNYAALREKYSPAICFEILSLPCFLLMHNRRKTEILLHNMRYLCVNPLADFCQLGPMLAEFAAPTYSAFDHAILRGLSTNYIKYFKTIRAWSEGESNDPAYFSNCQIHHPYANRTLQNIDDLTYVIYSTYMMSKGAFDQGIEQVNNMKSIMENHKTFREEVDANINHRVSLDEDFESLKKSDFAYSPDVCYNVGKLLAAKITQKHAAAKLRTSWNRLLDEPIDTMANNRGLRDEGKTFFGHKGYYVVYKKLAERDMPSILEALDEEDPIKCHKKLKELNDTYITEQQQMPLSKAILHVVDKVQRGGPVKSMLWTMLPSCIRGQ